LNWCCWFEFWTCNTGTGRVSLCLFFKSLESRSESACMELYIRYQSLVIQAKIYCSGVFLSWTFFFLVAGEFSLSVVACFILWCFEVINFELLWVSCLGFLSPLDGCKYRLWEEVCQNIQAHRLSLQQNVQFK